MAAPFDPYYTWLGIPPAEQPPHHYRLLGVPPFESDMAVIGNAADRQMVYVKTFVDGPHDETAKRVLAELRTARLCLFDSEHKDNYDAKLRASLAGSGLSSGSGSSLAGESSPHHSVARPMPRRGFTPWGASPAAHQLPPPATPPPIPPPAVAVPQPMYSPLYSAAPYLPLGSAAMPPAAPVLPEPTTPVPLVSAPTPPEPATPAATLEAQRSASRPVPVEPPPPPTPAEAPAGVSPTGALLRDKQSRFREALLYAGAGGLVLLLGGIVLAYAFGGRRDEAEKVAKREKANKSSAANSDDENARNTSSSENELPSGDEGMPAEPSEPAETESPEPRPENTTPDVKPADPPEPPDETPQPASDPDQTLLVKPTDTVQTKPPAKPVKVKPLKAIKAHLEGDVLSDGTALLKELSKPNRPGESLQDQQALANSALAFVTPLLSESRVDEADKLASRIKDVGDRLKNKELVDLAKAAQIEVRRMSTVQPYLATLKTTPDDKRANTVVGKHLCLANGDFAQGLAHLAKGEEGPLREAAQLDLKSPTDPTAQVKLGDDWFELGKKEIGGFARAAVWYRRALPEVEGGLKLRAEKNLKTIAEDAAARKLLRMPGVSVISSRAPATLTISERKKLKGHSGGTLFVTFSTDGKSLLSAGADDLIKKWYLIDEPGPTEFTGHTGAVNALAVIDDGRQGTMFSSSADGEMRMWMGTNSTPFKGSSKITFVAASCDGRNLASGGSDGSVAFWALAGGKERKSMSAHDSSVLGLAFSPDGKTLASAGDDTVKLWNLLGQLKVTLPHAANVYTVAFSPDGMLVASGGKHKTVELWSAHTYDRHNPLEGHSAAVTSVAFSPDGCWLASADAKGEIIVWSPSTGKKQTSLGPRKDRIHCLAYSPDGRTLAAACEGGEILLLDVKVKFNAAEAPAPADSKE